jgi:hypothetical protein
MNPAREMTDEELAQIIAELDKWDRGYSNLVKIMGVAIAITILCKLIL